MTGEADASWRTMARSYGYLARCERPESCRRGRAVVGVACCFEERRLRERQGKRERAKGNGKHRWQPGRTRLPSHMFAHQSFAREKSTPSLGGRGNKAGFRGFRGDRGLGMVVGESGRKGRWRGCAQSSCYENASTFLAWEAGIEPSGTGLASSGSGKKRAPM